MNKFRSKPKVIKAYRWHQNGDHPDDAETPIDQRTQPWPKEGLVVRRFRRPDIPGDRPCKHCSVPMHDHGWIDTLEAGHNVCPGDWIITGVKGERYPCKPDIFDATYEVINEEE
ncbi:hypothetical protein LCGC14_2643990 [marine sediment metagenome]|uniref:Phage protein n=1 Tax=marine sediment metagenome TaxID=412755 RepID=A0A0F9C788_9ZZZZ